MLTINHRAGEDGKLFGSVTSTEIADAIQAARGIKVDRKKIRLEEPIRETGTYMVEVEVGGGVTASVKTIVAEAKVASAKHRASARHRIVPGTARPRNSPNCLRRRAPACDFLARLARI